MMRPPKPNTNMPTLGPLMAKSTVTRVITRDSIVPQNSSLKRRSRSSGGRQGFHRSASSWDTPFSLILVRSFTRAWPAGQCAESRRFPAQTSTDHGSLGRKGARSRLERPGNCREPGVRPAAGAGLTGAVPPAPAAVGTGGASTTMFSGQLRRSGLVGIHRNSLSNPRVKARGVTAIRTWSRCAGLGLFAADELDGVRPLVAELRFEGLDQFRLLGGRADGGGNLAVQLGAADRLGQLDGPRIVIRRRIHCAAGIARPEARSWQDCITGIRVFSCSVSVSGIFG